jgi:1,2-diacylglycerol 3-beta-glucosyltransferase
MNSIGDITIWLVALLQIPLLVVWALLTIYLLFLTITALAARLSERKQAPPGFVSTRFSILVPAHNEALVIEQCLDSLNTLDYPIGIRRLIVVADNCTDNTAQLAASKGVIVYQRHDDRKQGKGYALEWALQRLLSNDGGWTDAVVIFDADTVADPQFLRQIEARLRNGSLALQGQYNLLNPFDNWRTALLYSALLLHNRLRPLARQGLGWTTLLKGNGMCFARSVIERFGWNAYGLAEDIEYTTTLLEAGIRVEAAPGAVLYAEAPRTRRQADSQRMRWEGGRFALARRDGVRFLQAFFRSGSVARLDWAMDLLTPPMAILVGMPLLMAILNGVLTQLLGTTIVTFTAWIWLAVLAGTCIHVIGGLLISGADPRAYLYLLSTPLFLVWKLQIYIAMLLKRGPRGWVRTERTLIP